jgi:hypothetical protein
MGFGIFGVGDLTPDPMRFPSEVLERPRNEKAFAVIPVGYPAKDCEVPDLVRKTLGRVLVEIWAEGHIQRLSNLRCPGALWEQPDRAEALAAIGPDWQPGLAD